MSIPFLGEVRAIPFAKLPEGWLACDGRTLPISGNDQLFTLLGTAFGGDGVTTFGIPDLRSRVGIGAGTSPSHTLYSLGQSGGSETVQLGTSQVAVHGHAANCTTNEGTSPSPGGLIWASDAGSSEIYSTQVDSQMNSLAIAPNGNSPSAPHANIQPFLVVNFAIAVSGLWPQTEQTAPGGVYATLEEAEAAEGGNE